MRVGIEKIDLYAGRFCTDAVELAKARGKDIKDIVNQVMVEDRTVLPPYEDAVTLAVNASKRFLSPADLEQIELLIVGSESAVDFGKPISTWVHRYCELPANCRNFDTKHACYGATAALKMAATWVVSGARPGKKALVISTDFTRSNSMKSGYDFAGGGCAVAMLISADPKVLEIELNKTGYWTNEISDVFRPTARVEMGDNQVSLYSYLDALERSYDHYEQVVGTIDYDAHFRKHIYHAPFPGMTFQAHRTMLDRVDIQDSATVLTSFQEKVAESLHFAKRIGSAYGASNFVCLMGLLQTAENLTSGDRISIFAYGSGCQGEFYEGLIGTEACNIVRSLGIDQHLNARLRLAIEEYEYVEMARERYIDCPDYVPKLEDLSASYEEFYKDTGLLVLKRVENYHRKYDWA